MTAHSRVALVIYNLLVGALSWGLAELVLMPTAGGHTLTPVWPPVGLAVALAYLGGYRLLPGVALGAFMLALSRVPVYWAIPMGLVALVQPLVDVRILRWFKFDPRLERVQDPMVLSLVAGPVGALVAAAVRQTSASNADLLRRIEGDLEPCIGKGW